MTGTQDAPVVLTGPSVTNLQTPCEESGGDRVTCVAGEADSAAHRWEVLATVTVTSCIHGLIALSFDQLWRGNR